MKTLKRQSLGTTSSRPGFLAQVVLLSGGTALGQAIMVAASPVLTRLYSPDDFGVLSLFIAVVSTFAVIASFRYELAIPLVRSKRSAINVAVLAITCLILTASIVTAVCSLFHVQLGQLFHIPVSSFFFVLVPLSVLAVGFQQVFTNWMIRQQSFGPVSKARLFQGAGLVVAQLFFGVIGVGAGGLLAGQAIGQGIGAAALSQRALHDMKGSWDAVTVKRAGVYARRFRRFPFYSVWAALANTASMQAPIILLVVLFGPAVTGLYALSVRVLQAPMLLVGTAFGQVFFSRASKTMPKAELSTLTMQVFSGLLRLGMAPLAFVGLIAPSAFSFVFGEEWALAGVFVQWLAPFMLLVFVTSPLSMIPSILERQSGEMFFQISLLCVRLLALIAGWAFGGAALSVALYAIVGAVWFGYFMIWNLRLVGVRYLKILYTFFKEAAIAFAVVIPSVIAVATDLLLTEPYFWVLHGLTLLFSLFVLASTLKTRLGT